MSDLNKKAVSKIETARTKNKTQCLRLIYYHRPTTHYLYTHTDHYQMQLVH